MEQLSLRLRLKATVTGRVQGVGFRMYVQEEAERLALAGYVRNDRYDRRRLEVVAEGEPEALQSLWQALEAGPPGARVEGVQASWEEAQNAFAGFKVEL